MTATLPFVVLYEDRDWIVVEKPARMATTLPTPPGVEALTELVRASLKGDGPCHPLSRLDVGVSGAVVFARTREAVTLAEKARAEGRYARTYEALVSPAPRLTEGVWDTPISVDPKNPKRRVAVVGRGEPAETAYSVEDTRGAVALVRMVPKTGRTHQLRVHLATVGSPVLGDAVYGGLRRWVGADGAVVALARPMLHLVRVTVPGRAVEVTSAWAADMRALWDSLPEG